MRTASIIAIALCGAAVASDTHPSISDSYRDPAARLIGAALTDSTGYERLAFLCDSIGARLSGSDALNQAIAWAASEMRKDGLENVSTPPVTVSHWIRGRESLEMNAPVHRHIPMLGIGDSTGTPASGITASVVPVASFEQLEQLGHDAIAGNIVLFNVPFVSYGQAVQFRSRGASAAAKLGAVAVLVRSAGSASLRTPHTGALRYDPNTPKIPAAAVTWEDAMMIQRWTDRGQKVRVTLHMEAHFAEPSQSANVIGEIRGRENPEQVVAIGGHIDSWDVGQGAHDDGAGVMAALDAVRLIRVLGLHPRRTIRVVFWTNEENGVAGGKAYRAAVGDAINTHVAAIEMDGGSEQPVGFETTSATPADLRILEQIGGLLRGISAGRIIPSAAAETDISPLAMAGVPALGLRTVMEHYFDWHHTEADTVDKVKPVEFQRNVAALAVMAYVLADMPDTLSRKAAEPRQQGILNIR